MGWYIRSTEEKMELITLLLDQEIKFPNLKQQIVLLLYQGTTASKKARQNGLCLFERGIQGLKANVKRSVRTSLANKTTYCASSEVYTLLQLVKILAFGLLSNLADA